MLVVIPFQDEFAYRMLEGRKVVTTQTKVYGRQGDTFYAFGQAFILKAVIKAPLEMVARLLYLAEGFKTEREFNTCWQKLHPIRGWRPWDLVYVHYFEKTQISLQPELVLDKVAVT